MKHTITLKMQAPSLIPYSSLSMSRILHLYNTEQPAVASSIDAAPLHHVYCGSYSTRACLVSGFAPSAAGLHWTQQNRLDAQIPACLKHLHFEARRDAEPRIRNQTARTCAALRS